jgi:GMP synthase PP-ATPase subunit
MRLNAFFLSVNLVRIAGFLSEISYAKDFDEKRLASLKHFKNKKEFFEYLESNSNAFRLSVYLAQGNLSIDGDDSKIEQTQKLYANMNKLKEKYGFLKSDDQKLDRVINAYFNA